MLSTFSLCEITTEVVGLKRGQTKRAWTPEQQAEIVHKHLDEHISVRTLKKPQYDLSLGKEIYHRGRIFRYP